MYTPTGRLKKTPEQLAQIKKKKQENKERQEAFSKKLREDEERRQKERDEWNNRKISRDKQITIGQNVVTIREMSEEMEKYFKKLGNIYHHDYYEDDRANPSKTVATHLTLWEREPVDTLNWTSSPRLQSRYNDKTRLELDFNYLDVFPGCFKRISSFPPTEMHITLDVEDNNTNYVVFIEMVLQILTEIADSHVTYLRLKGFPSIDDIGENIIKDLLMSTKLIKFNNFMLDVCKYDHKLDCEYSHYIDHESGCTCMFRNEINGYPDILDILNIPIEDRGIQSKTKSAMKR